MNTRLNGWIRLGLVAAALIVTLILLDSLDSHLDRLLGPDARWFQMPIWAFAAGLLALAVAWVTSGFRKRDR